MPLGNVNQPISSTRLEKEMEALRRIAEAERQKSEHKIATLNNLSNTYAARVMIVMAQMAHRSTNYYKGGEQYRIPEIMRVKMTYPDGRVEFVTSPVIELPNYSKGPHGSLLAMAGLVMPNGVFFPLDGAYGRTVLSTVSLPTKFGNRYPIVEGVDSDPNTVLYRDSIDKNQPLHLSDGRILEFSDVNVDEEIDNVLSELFNDLCSTNTLITGEHVTNQELF